MPGERGGEGGWFQKLFGGSKSEQPDQGRATMIPARVRIEGRWQNVDLLDTTECPVEVFKGWVESQPETKALQIPWESFDRAQPAQRREVLARFIEGKESQSGRE